MIMVCIRLHAILHYRPPNLTQYPSSDINNMIGMQCLARVHYNEAKEKSSLIVELFGKVIKERTRSRFKANFYIHMPKTYIYINYTIFTAKQILVVQMQSTYSIRLQEGLSTTCVLL